MTCPTDNDWTLVSMDLLDEDRMEWMREHLQTCSSCRARFGEIRRDHVGLLRAYEAMDRDHDIQREQLLASLPTDSPQPDSKGWLSRGWRRLGDLTVNHPRTRRAAGLLSAAAVIALAISIFLGPGDRLAFANVVKRLREIDTITCRIASNTMIAGLDIPVTGKMYMSSEYGTRCDFGAFGLPSTTLFKRVDGPAIIVTPITKSYVVMEGEEQDASFDHMRDPDAFLKKLRELSEDASELLGSDQIDGREVVGFEIPAKQLGLWGSEVSALLYVDAESALPVRLAVEMPGPEPGSHMKILYDQFEWDTPLDADLFEPTIPEDYVEINIQLPPKDEATLIEVLGMYAELTDGRYPDDLDAMQLVMNTVRLLSDQMAANGEKPTPGTAAYGTLSQKVVAVGAAVEFHQRLIQEGREPEYFGREVTADDADAVLMRWRLDDRHVRVIYGDLAVETVLDHR